MLVKHLFSLRCRRLLLVLALGLALPLAQAQGLPSLGDAGEMTVLEERKLGDAIIGQLYRDPDYLDDPIVGEYVDALWQRLLAAARERGELLPELDERFAWQVLLGRDRSINAFALPGGYFGLHLGLVGVVATRDELASVLAHELSHVTQRHIARLIGQESRQAPLLMAAMVAGMVAASKNPEAGAAVMMGGQAAIIQQQLNFSRDMEREADRIGFGILAQAGFAPQGFASMFEKLQAATRIDDSGDWPYLRSHPLTSQRVADMQQRVGPQPGALPPDLETALVAARARVLSRSGVDGLRAWATEPEQAGFEQLPLARRAAALYAAALAQARLRQVDVGRQLADRLLPLVAHDAPAQRQVLLLQAELALQAGQAGQVLSTLDAIEPVPVTTTPGSGPDQADRAALMLRSQAQLAMGSADQALARLQDWVSVRPHDAEAWQLLARVAQAAGQPLRALRAEGEVQMVRMDYAGAIDRWRAAQDLARRQPGGPAELIEASIVDARLREAQQAKYQQEQDEKKRRR